MSAGSSWGGKSPGLKRDKPMQSLWTCWMARCCLWSNMCSQRSSFNLRFSFWFILLTMDCSNSSARSNRCKTPTASTSGTCASEATASCTDSSSGKVSDGPASTSTTIGKRGVDSLASFALAASINCNTPSGLRARYASDLER